ncbi:putative serine/threonine protein phosphatase [Besnoitia besnoiti]|uniref:Serine/threonine-protein phosphatase n=1 Tax=Besnoitia besnoiti TaxID=94643 RepID=A0A2A9M996_BESBE|nr:putative serine/threonine protein phosphatase [Besnoitia besnoiti]PFH32253.1 putative serine/threonine protein phosphatase [Besnoitia besnoiti]
MCKSDSPSRPCSTEGCLESVASTRPISAAAEAAEAEISRESDAMEALGAAIGPVAAAKAQSAASAGECGVASQTEEDLRRRASRGGQAESEDGGGRGDTGAPCASRAAQEAPEQRVGRCGTRDEGEGAHQGLLGGDSRSEVDGGKSGSAEDGDAHAAEACGSEHRPAPESGEPSAGEAAAAEEAPGAAACCASANESEAGTSRRRLSAEEGGQKGHCEVHAESGSSSTASSPSTAPSSPHDFARASHEDKHQSAREASSAGEEGSRSSALEAPCCPSTGAAQEDRAPMDSPGPSARPEAAVGGLGGSLEGALFAAASPETSAALLPPCEPSNDEGDEGDSDEGEEAETIVGERESCLGVGKSSSAGLDCAERGAPLPGGGGGGTADSQRQALPTAAPCPAPSLPPAGADERVSSGVTKVRTKIRKNEAGDLDAWIEGFHENPPEILSEADLWRVCQRIKQLLVEENNVQPVPAPCIVCGDIHGQFFDLLKLFEVGGKVGEQKYVFLGDYVDRGYNSVETFEYLMLLKLKYPESITLLRGNHESRQITTVYGFYDECVRKYGNANPWKFCTEVFDYLALAAVIDESVFCVHGGLSPDLKLLDQLRLIYRVQEIPHEGTFGDIVWSDPDEVEGWAENPRGAGWLFGDKVVRRFNHVNGLELIARAHQLAMEGFRYIFSDSSVVTVWSAPNYCYRCGNVAAVMKLDANLNRKMLIFKQTDDPQVATRARAIAPYFL